MLKKYDFIHSFILFNNWFVFSSDTHSHNTSWSSNHKLEKYSHRNNTYGKNLITELQLNHGII